MSRFIGPDAERTIDPEVLAKLQAQHKSGCAWITYQNHDLGHHALGDSRFLLVGPGATFASPPRCYPDTQFGLGWRYLPVGTVNLETGRIEDLPDEQTYYIIDVAEGTQ